ncbi:MAG TPA: hypothetical protein VL003_00340, partial [Pusillimonas sp.]|nr:hypothetical protein [Pusillimonas sp.]
MGGNFSEQLVQRSAAQNQSVQPAVRAAGRKVVRQRLFCNFIIKMVFLVAGEGTSHELAPEPALYELPLFDSKPERPYHDWGISEQKNLVGKGVWRSAPQIGSER